ncbi:MAG: penicillin-binding protein [Rhodospirillaceae bacterium]|nr:MAG: penicillin-binding protein [Rhodospirillaceae bacterium]
MNRQPRQQTDRAHRRAIETGRTRLVLMGALAMLAFLAVGVRLVDVMALREGHEPRLADANLPVVWQTERADILDRNGEILATNLRTASLYADPKKVQNPRQAAQRLARLLPGLNRAATFTLLTSNRRFIWIRRHLTPRQQYAVNALGIPGLYFQHEERRAYPHGHLAAHVVGFTGVDNRGLAGIEKSFDEVLRNGSGPLRLSLDIRVQHILADEIAGAMQRFQAIAGIGVVMDVTNGEVLGLVSLPDFDPNRPGAASPNALFNRATLGIYEMGSTFKIFTAAMALESGTATIQSIYDASKPIRVARFLIRDFKPKNRWLSMPEILMYSSNIGAAKMAMDVGTDRQRAYLAKLGLLNQADIELPEIGTPLSPKRWREINLMTIAYGHGLAVSPLQLTSAVATVANGGIALPATMLHQPNATAAQDAAKEGRRVFSPETSERMRRLLRLVVAKGTGRNAAAKGYLVGGKTGTAEKISAKGYARKSLRASFIGAFPMHAPRYAVFVMLDEPKGDKKSFGYATGGWVAAPLVSRIVTRMAPLVGVAPIDENAPAIKQRMFIEINDRGQKLASF